MKLQTCDIVSASFGISQIQMVYTVEQIFNQLKCRLIGHESRTGDRPCYTNNKWCSQKLNSVRFSIYNIVYIIIYYYFHTGYGTLDDKYCPYFISRVY